MKEEGFRKHLKKMGKKMHVVEGLVGHVRAFEAYLENHNKGLDGAKTEDLQGYIKTLAPQEGKKQLRGLALYFRFGGNSDLAKLASSLREVQIAQTRQAFKLRDFRGVRIKEVTQLEGMGIVTVEDMLVAGKTPERRKQLSEQAGVPLPTILELVKLSDLSRLGAIKSVRARLYYEAGLDTPDRFADWEPEALRKMLIAFVKRTGFNGIAPLPKELKNVVRCAKELPKAVEY